LTDKIKSNSYQKLGHEKLGITVMFSV